MKLPGRWDAHRPRARIETGVRVERGSREGGGGIRRSCEEGDELRGVELKAGMGEEKGVVWHRESPSTGPRCMG